MNAAEQVPWTCTRWPPARIHVAAMSGKVPEQAVVAGSEPNRVCAATFASVASWDADSFVRPTVTGPVACTAPLTEIVTVNGTMFPLIRPNE